MCLGSLRSELLRSVVMTEEANEEEEVVDESEVILTVGNQRPIQRGVEGPTEEVPL